MKKYNIYMMMLCILLLGGIFFSACNFSFPSNTTLATTTVPPTTPTSTETSTTTTVIDDNLEPEVEIITIPLSELLDIENIEFIVAIEKKNIFDSTFSPRPQENLDAFLQYLDTSLNVTNDPIKVSDYYNVVMRACFYGRGMTIDIAYKDNTEIMDKICIDWVGNFLYCDYYYLPDGSHGCTEYVFSNLDYLEYDEIKAILGIK